MRNAFVGAIVSCLVFCPGAFAQPVMAEGDPVVMPDTPSGEGEPNTIVCRAPQPIAGTDQLGPRFAAIITNGRNSGHTAETLPPMVRQWSTSQWLPTRREKVIRTK
jgi:hypothetical protein